MMDGTNPFEAIDAALGIDPREDGPITEDRIALAFTAQHGDTMRFDHDAGRWYEWQSDHWKPDPTSRAFSYCRDLARRASDHAHVNDLKQVRKAAFSGGVEKMARTDPAHAVTQDAWDGDPWLLGCPRQTIDLRTGEGRQPDPGDGITRRAAVPSKRLLSSLYFGIGTSVSGPWLRKYSKWSAREFRRFLSFLVA